MHPSIVVGRPVRAPGAGGQPGSPAARGVAAAPTLLCQTEPDLFFSENPEDLRLAKALCEHCPLRYSCLAGALERGEPWGVWGGELFLNGQVIAGKRGRGRPRKAEVAA